MPTALPVSIVFLQTRKSHRQSERRVDWEQLVDVDGKFSGGLTCIRSAEDYNFDRWIRSMYFEQDRKVLHFTVALL